MKRFEFLYLYCLVGDHPDADNVNHMKMVWNLCENLWGDIPESLKPNSKSESSINAYQVEQIRKRLLGEWLSEVSSQRVEKECKYMKFNKVLIFFYIYSVYLITQFNSKL